MMSTLTTDHDGALQPMRALVLMVTKLYAGQRFLVDDGTWPATTAESTGSPASASVPQSAAASQQKKVSLLGSLLARWRAERIRQRSYRELEAVMATDPRMRGEFLAAKAYAEWHD
jgi:hypothetical protein